MPPGLRRHHDRPPEWAIPCPLNYCWAKVNTPCIGRTTGRPVAAGVHPSRAKAWILTTQPAA
ncbi:hypothetical protein [Kitasatospora sp. NPDC005856]|uniref:zinc finger domain-containing protein n=1 Tax=Kitasatospora sp. NPDC005856 TaxID=3154566 RepID=UPI0033DEAE0E